MKNFEGKTAIVTGAGTGIGLAIASALSDAGANVVINDIDANAVDSFVDSGKRSGLTGDISSLQEIDRLIDYTVNRHGKIDLLVCNAGLTHFDHFLDISEANFDKVVDLNIKGTFFLTQQVAKLMKNSGGGKIVLISSNIGTLAYPKLAIYSMTKAAINMMAKSLATDLKGLNINVNCLAPGPTATPRTVKETENYYEKWGKILTTGKSVEVEDIANAALFLLSDEASQINGQTIYVDGGWNTLGVVPDFS